MTHHHGGSARCDSRLRIGATADSWGIWFAYHPKQIPWNRFLDEVKEVGYHYLELGPFGYLPTDGSLKDELEKRGLALSAGTAFTAYHRGENARRQSRLDSLAIAEFIHKLGAEYLVVLPGWWREPNPEGTITEPRTITEEQWELLTKGHDELGRELYEKYGIKQVFHPHADTHVGTFAETEKFLSLTDKKFTNLCLDVGHFAYYGGDALKLIATRPERIKYLHLKQIDPNRIMDILKNDLSFYDAVTGGVMVEPPNGAPPYAPIIEAASRVCPGAFAMVEQDKFGCDPSEPLPAARRTKSHIFDSCRFARVR